MELLVALAIIALITTLTLPKILLSDRGDDYDAVTKQTIAAISGAYETHKAKNGVSSTSTFADVTPYINYVKVDTTRTIDDKPGSGSLSCGSTGGCLILHNGGALRWTSPAFGGTSTTNAIELYFDPDGEYGNTTNGTDKSVNLFLYYNGKVHSRGHTVPNTAYNGTTYATPNTSLDPSWYTGN